MKRAAYVTADTNFTTNDISMHLYDNVDGALGRIFTSEDEHPCSTRDKTDVQIKNGAVVCGFSLHAMDRFDWNRVLVLTKEGFTRLADYPNSEKWQGAMTPGEFFSFIKPEDWATHKMMTGEELEEFFADTIEEQTDTV